MMKIFGRAGTDREPLPCLGCSSSVVTKDHHENGNPDLFWAQGYIPHPNGLKDLILVIVSWVIVMSVNCKVNVQRVSSTRLFGNVTPSITLARVQSCVRS